MIFDDKSGSRIRYDAGDALQNLLDLDFLALLSCSHILVSSEESSNGLKLGPEGTTIGQSCLSSLQVYTYVVTTYWRLTLAAGWRLIFVIFIYC